MDYSQCHRSQLYYSGSERKIGVIVDGEEWILKFQYKDEFGSRFNHISEHLGSEIFRMLGIESQTTALGTYKGEQVVACKNFITNGYQFVPFNDVGESTLETNKEQFQYSYDDIMEMLNLNKKITDLEGTVDRFWDMYIIDALLGNFDRHGGNWGFLKNDNKYILAPVFDNGSSLFPQMTDEGMMLKIMDSEELTDERVYRFPTSQIKLHGRKSSYHDVISSLEFTECNEALERIYPRTRMDKINDLVNGIDQITDVHKRFYIHMIERRFEKILEEPYEKLIG